MRVTTSVQDCLLSVSDSTWGGIRLCRVKMRFQIADNLVGNRCVSSSTQARGACPLSDGESLTLSVREHS
ncbi:MAG: hypothetical protein A2286_05750 [Gammaproteobacteria bacterium RIFOXYA12_FULL_61_12]|nr:MAG: hypothetical protein A2286_05750 [Gammaproteobacteria bacterium RIFOXYA12_FULL_61_12]